jgi:hypothetical protein
MATYYVSPTGSNTSPYDSWAKAANLPATVVTAGNSVAGPHTVYLAPGTYVGGAAVSNANWVGGSFYGTAASGSTSPAAKGQVILAPGSGRSFGCWVNNVTLSDVSLTASTASGGNDALYLTGGTGFTGQHVAIYDAGGCGVNVANGATGTLVQCSILGCGTTAGTYGILVTNGASSLTIYSSLITNSATMSSGISDGIRNDGTGTLIIYGCTVLGPANCTIDQAGSGTTTCTNCIMGSSCDSVYPFKRSAGTLNISNCLLLSNPGNTLMFSGTIGDTANVKDANVRFVRRMRSGYIVPCIDDSGGATYAQAIEDELSSRGLHGTWFVDAAGGQAIAATVQAVLARGTLSISGHGYSHSTLTATGNIYSITKGGATITVDRAGNQITVDPGGTVTAFKAKTLDAIKTELTGFGCTVGAYPAGLQGTSLGEDMADSAGAQASPYTPQLLIDTTAATGFFNVEIAQCKSLMESYLPGYTGKGFGTPTGTTSANIRAAVHAAGYLGCRVSKYSPLGSTNVYDHGYQEISSKITYSAATDADVQARTRRICEHAAQNGYVVYLLAHNTSECTAHQWGVILDTIAEYAEITVASHDQVLADIRTGGLWTTSDQITYTRTWTDLSDYHLLATSPAIDVGTNLGTPYNLDYEGTDQDSCGPAWEMGGYAFTPPAESSDPMLIHDAYELQAMEDGLDEEYVLANDIDCSAANPNSPDWDSTEWPGTAGFRPVGLPYGGEFSGTLDGAGHTISGLYISAGDFADAGLFGDTTSGASISHVQIAQATVVYTGTDEFTDALIGILVGYAYDTDITDCSVSGTITATCANNETIGGFVGDCEARIARCYSDVTIDVSVGPVSPAVGGFIGCSYGYAESPGPTLLQQCGAVGTITLHDGAAAEAGGFVGAADVHTQITDCYARVTISSTGVTTTTDVGGFVGLARDADETYTNCFAAGPLSAGGGFIGALGGEAVTCTNCFWDTQTSGQGNSAGGIGQTTAQLQDLRTFTNLTYNEDLTAPVWDFVGTPGDDAGTDDYWQIDPAVNGGYPYLVGVTVTATEEDPAPAVPTAETWALNASSADLTGGGTVRAAPGTGYQLVLDRLVLSVGGAVGVTFSADATPILGPLGGAAGCWDLDDLNLELPENTALTVTAGAAGQVCLAVNAHTKEL